MNEPMEPPTTGDNAQGRGTCQLTRSLGVVAAVVLIQWMLRAGGMV